MTHAEDRRSFSYIKTYWPLIVAMFCAAGAWFQVKINLANVEKEVAEKSAKYIPIIEASEHRITIVEERSAQTLEIVKRIERKMDRDH